MQLVSPHIEDWHLPISDDDGTLRLQGTVTGHPNFQNGKVMMSTPIVQFNIESGICITEQFSYTLGRPNETFLEFLKENQIELSKFNTGPPILN